MVEVEAVPNGRGKQRAPGTLGEVEVCGGLSQVYGINCGLEGLTNHHIVSNIFIGTAVLGEFEEQRLVGGGVGLVRVGDLCDLGVVVAHQMVLSLNCRLHDIHVALPGSIVIAYVLESPGLLGFAPTVSVIPGEWLEGADLVPPGAQVGGGVGSTEAADVSTDQCDAEHVHFHNAKDAFLEVDDISVVIS